MFVQATAGECRLLGVGKLIDQSGSICSVEYFDSPASERVVHEIESSLIEHVTLVEQTRLYIFDEVTGAWEIGGLLTDRGDSQLVQLANKKSKEVKADVPIRRDPPCLVLSERS